MASRRRVPIATYRLQFNRHFTFKDATEIIPYLQKLGSQRHLQFAIFPLTAGQRSRVRRHQSQRVKSENRHARGVRRDGRCP